MAGTAKSRLVSSGAAALPGLRPWILEIHEDPAIAFGLRQPVVALPGRSCVGGVIVIFLRYCRSEVLPLRRGPMIAAFWRGGCLSRAKMRLISRSRPKKPRGCMIGGPAMNGELSSAGGWVIATARAVAATGGRIDPHAHRAGGTRPRSASLMRRRRLALLEHDRKELAAPSGGVARAAEQALKIGPFALHPRRRQTRRVWRLWSTRSPCSPATACQSRSRGCRCRPAAQPLPAAAGLLPDPVGILVAVADKDIVPVVRL